MYREVAQAPRGHIGTQRQCRYQQGVEAPTGGVGTKRAYRHPEVV